MASDSSRLSVTVSLVSGETAEIKLLPGSRISDLKLDEFSKDSHILSGTFSLVASSYLIFGLGKAPLHINFVQRAKKTHGTKKVSNRNYKVQIRTSKS